MPHKQESNKNKVRGKTVEIKAEYKNWLKAQAVMNNMTMQEFAEFIITEFRKTHKDK